MNEKITHFGIQFQKRKFQFNLVEEEYCLVNDKVSLPYFSEIVMHDYEYFPKSFIVDYLSKLLAYYDGLHTLSSKQKRLQINAKEILAKVQKFDETRHLQVLKRVFKIKNDDKEKLVTTEKKILQRANNYDLEKSIEGRIYSKEWCEIQEKEVRENFQINMDYFDSLNQEEFEKEIDNFIENNKEFKEISDLTKFMFKPGYYVMVLGKYKQVYVGTTEDIEKRIITHWQKVKQFDRLIFPWHAVETSKLSIDSFRVLDTTRIFVYTTKDIYSKEEEYIEKFSPKFVLNRVTGGNLVVIARKQMQLKEKK